jgi:hypothetical protein
MFDLQNWSPVLLVCLAGCGIGVLVVAGFFFRLGLNIFTDVLGGIAGTQRARLPAPPPRPSFNPAPPQAQAAPPPMSFDEALARRQGMAPPAGPGFAPMGPPINPMLSQGVPLTGPSFGPMPGAPLQGGVPNPSLPPQGLPPRPGFQPMQPTFPPMQPPAGGLARPSLSQGVPYRPSAGLPAVGVPPSFGTPNNPFDERRRNRRLQDDRYEIYTDEDDAGGGLDMLF